MQAGNDRPPRHSGGVQNGLGLSTGCGSITLMAKECRPEPTSNTALPSGSDTPAVVFGGTEMSSANAVPSNAQATDAVP